MHWLRCFSAKVGSWPLIGLLLIAGSVKLSAQEEELIEFHGKVMNELLEPLQFVHVVILNKNQGTISDQNGMFSFVAEPHDTVLFSAVGYKKKYHVIPDTLEDYTYTTDITMQTDTIMIGEIFIYPWKTYEEFKKAFINLELPDDDLKRAYKNIAIIQAQIAQSRSPDPQLNYKYFMKEYYDKLYYRGQYPSYTIFNPFAWAEFFRYLKEGKFRQE